MGNYPPSWWWEWDAGNSNYRGLVVIGLENGQGTRVKQGRTNHRRNGRHRCETCRDWKDGYWNHRESGLEQYWKEWQWARAKAISMRGRPQGEGWQVFSSENCCLFLCPLIFPELSFMVCKEMTLLSFTRCSQGRYTPFSSHFSRQVSDKPKATT